MSFERPYRNGILELDPVGETIDAWIETLTNIAETNPAFKTIRLSIEDGQDPDSGRDPVYHISIRAETE